MGILLAMATCRLSDWDKGECRPVLNRAQLLARMSEGSSFVSAEFSTLIEW